MYVHRQCDTDRKSAHPVCPRLTGDERRFSLSSAEISRLHAEIIKEEDRYILRDLGSRTGTFVNDETVIEHTLGHDDRIRIGRHSDLRFLLKDSSETATRATTSAVGDLRQTATLLEGLRALGTAKVLDQVLVMVIDYAITLSGTERGFIMLVNPAGALEFTLGRGPKQATLSCDTFKTSRKIPEQVFATAEPQLVADLYDEMFAEAQGEFNWSSQHLDDEVLQCRDGNGEGQTGRVGLRCVRLVGRRQRGVRSSNGSGRRSRGGCRVRMPLCPVACRRPWVVVGSVRAVVCRRSAWRPDRLATCPVRSGKRSRSCELRAPGCVTLPVGSGEPRRLSRESYVATRRLGAAVWRIGRRLRSGTAPDVPSARR